MKQAKVSGGRKKIIVFVVIGLIVIGVGIASGLLFFTAKKQAATTTNTKYTADEQKQLEADSRSLTTKEAALDARNQTDKGDISGAVVTLRTAIGHASSINEKVSLYRQISTIYTNSGNKQAALDAIHSAIVLSPNDWTLYKNLGLIDEAFQDYTAATADYTKADSMLDQKSANYQAYHNALQSLIKQAEAGR